MTPRSEPSFLRVVAEQVVFVATVPAVLMVFEQLRDPTSWLRITISNTWDEFHEARIHAKVEELINSVRHERGGESEG
jgi:hypothetical protein